MVHNEPFYHIFKMIYKSYKTYFGQPQRFFCMGSANSQLPIVAAFSSVEAPSGWGWCWCLKERSKLSMLQVNHEFHETCHSVTFYFMKKLIL